MADSMWTMDESPRATPEYLREGFAGQRMVVVARPVVSAALTRPVTRRLLVTDAGFFPHAARHGRTRPAGSREHILMVCSGGAGWCRTPDGRFDVQRGDALLLPAGVSHEYVASERDPWTLWWMHVTGADAAELVHAARAATGGVLSRLRDAGTVTALLAQVVDGLDAATAGGLVRASGAAWNALTEVIATGRRTRGSTLGPIERAVEHLRATAPRRTAVEELATMVGLSTSQFGAHFREQVGVPPLRYQNDLRMARARELLDSSTMPVAAVASACGYEDPLYFSRQFTKTHGVPPTAYRERQA
ncbi:helix-turn-helix domain-containing protein [Miniimonas arenae]|uniref:helix-turn-helix domain-containing protein n=1 Tax=Miniimonas arenae TaxID=676201 RepID=UPI0028A8F8A4|nr:helix-turn-helix domain-containing protein [Miniimonas arenae]